jgi:hypothetical protein
MDEHRGVNWHAADQEIEESQVMFGSDLPYREAMEAVQGLANYKLSEADLRTIESENSLQDVPAAQAGLSRLAVVGSNSVRTLRG